MTTILETRNLILKDKENWSLYLMNFVDEFRYYKDYNIIREGFAFELDKMDPLLASTVEYLCKELKMESPEWTQEIPACKYPYFVAGVENLKAIALAESPLVFRIRKIFVLRNFLDRF